MQNVHTFVGDAVLSQGSRNVALHPRPLPGAMSKKEDALKGENKALRLQLNHLSDELVKSNQEIMRLSTAVVRATGCAFFRPLLGAPIALELAGVAQGRLTRLPATPPRSHLCRFVCEGRGGTIPPSSWSSLTSTSQLWASSPFSFPYHSPEHPTWCLLCAASACRPC